MGAIVNPSLEALVNLALQAASRGNVERRTAASIIQRKWDIVRKEGRFINTSPQEEISR
jgi:hypothetical protein